MISWGIMQKSLFAFMLFLFSVAHNLLKMDFSFMRMNIKRINSSMVFYGHETRSIVFPAHKFSNLASGSK